MMLSPAFWNVVVILSERLSSAWTTALPFSSRMAESSAERDPRTALKFSVFSVISELAAFSVVARGVTCLGTFCCEIGGDRIHAIIEDCLDLGRAAVKGFCHFEHLAAERNIDFRNAIGQGFGEFMGLTGQGFTNNSKAIVHALVDILLTLGVGRGNIPCAIKQCFVDLAGTIVQCFAKLAGTLFQGAVECVGLGREAGCQAGDILPRNHPDGRKCLFRNWWFCR